jgi:hypothetical protein
MQRRKEERSSHACGTGAMLSHACSTGDTHDRSSMVVLTTFLTRVMRVFVLKVDQRIDGDDSF